MNGWRSFLNAGGVRLICVPVIKTISSCASINNSLIGCIKNEKRLMVIQQVHFCKILLHSLYSHVIRKHHLLDQEVDKK